jgi:hypothetical protein
MPDFSVILQSPQVRAIVQENALDRFFSDALYPKNQFRAEAKDEKWDAQLGDNKTFTGKGLMKPTLRPLVPGQDPTPKDYRLEQWTATMQQFADTIDTHLPTAMTAIVNKLKDDMQALGENAGTTLNRMPREKLYNAGESGWTVADGVTTASTTARVKRLNGFTRARRPDLALGSAVRYDFVSANNPLPISKVTASVTTNVNVIGFTPDNPGDEIGPGTLTLDAAITLADRDPVFASNRTYRVVAGGGNTVDALTTATDILHLSDIRSAVARLKTMNVPSFGDGKYHMHLDPVQVAQLFADNEVQRLNIGVPDSVMYKDMAIGNILSCILYENNECPTPENVEGGTSATFSVNDPFAGELWTLGNPSTGTRVHRAIVIGEGALNEYWFDQMQLTTEAGVTGKVERGAHFANNGVEMEVERIKVIMRAPQDRLQQIVANTWTFMGDFVVRTDGATGDAATFKRVVSILTTE